MKQCWLHSVAVQRVFSTEKKNKDICLKLHKPVLSFISHNTSNNTGFSLWQVKVCFLKKWDKQDSREKKVQKIRWNRIYFPLFEWIPVFLKNFCKNFRGKTTTMWHWIYYVLKLLHTFTSEKEWKNTVRRQWPTHTKK